MNMSIAGVPDFGTNLFGVQHLNTIEAHQFVPCTTAGGIVAEALAEHRDHPPFGEDRLDKLADIRDGIQQIQTAKQKFIDSILSEHHYRLEGFDADILQLQDLAEPLEEQVRQCVLSLGESIKGHRLQAVWAKGRETWDSKMLQGFALAYPEINAAKKVGEPSVSIRALKG